MQFVFGFGGLYLTPAGANATPLQIGIIRDVSLEIATTLKELRGESMFPIHMTRTTGKASGKIKTAQIHSTHVGAVLPNSTTATGGVVGVKDYVAVIPTTPFQITAPLNGGSFDSDLGVKDVATGAYLAKVASGPVTGQYSVSGVGVYTFAAADVAKSVAICYAYTSVTGKTISLDNGPNGSSSPFQLSLFNSTDGKSWGIRLFSIHMPKWAFSLKQEDYADNDLDFEVSANTAGQVARIYLSE